MKITLNADQKVSLLLYDTAIYPNPGRRGFLQILEQDISLCEPRYAFTRSMICMICTFTWKSERASVSTAVLLYSYRRGVVLFFRLQNTAVSSRVCRASKYRSHCRLSYAFLTFDSTYSRNTAVSAFFVRADVIYCCSCA